MKYLYQTAFIAFTAWACPTWAHLEEGEVPGYSISTQVAPPSMDGQQFNAGSMHDDARGTPLDIAYGNLQYHLQASTQDMQQYVDPFLQALQLKGASYDMQVALMHCAGDYAQRSFPDTFHFQYTKLNLSSVLDMCDALGTAISAVRTDDTTDEIVCYNIHWLYRLALRLFPENEVLHIPVFEAFAHGMEATNHRPKVVEAVLNSTVHVMGPSTDADQFQEVFKNLIGAAYPYMGDRDTDDLKPLYDQLTVLEMALARTPLQDILFFIKAFTAFAEGAARQEHAHQKSQEASFSPSMSDELQETSTPGSRDTQFNVSP